MAIALPAPKVLSLGPNNTVDLDDLGDSDLETYIDYPEIAEGDAFWPNWRGCSENGEIIDHFNNLVEITPGDLKPQGMPVYIANAQLKALDQGWVFYSYQMDDAIAPGRRGEESLRRFFYVGKRSSNATLLPVPQFKESHDRQVDLSLIGAGGATVVTMPYQAMSVGDKVTLTIELAFDDGFPWDPPFEKTKELTEVDIGSPLQWTVQASDLEVIDGGFATLSWCIKYADPTVPSNSHKQELRILPPTTPLLPPLAIKDFNGDMLDPEAYPDGAILTIPLYPGIQLGDDVVLYANGDTRVTRSVRVDKSTIDSNKLEMVLDYAWLAANNGYEVSLIYQYARVGSAGTSSALSLTLRKPLHLPLPIIKDVIRDGQDDENRGYLLARNTTNGVTISIPVGAVIGAGDKVQMIWEGHENGGRYTADPTVGDPKRFQIPVQYVPANLGKRLRVFYQVTPPGEGPYNSTRFNLEIKDMETGWPTVQISSPASPGNKVSLATVTDAVTFLLRSWTFMEEGQRVRITATGTLSAGGKETVNVREGAAEVVTEDEYYAGELHSKLPLAFLQKLQLNAQFDVLVETSFDGGFSYKKFPMISPQLVA